MIGSMPNHDRFECQTAIDSDAILHTMLVTGAAFAAIDKRLLLPLSSAAYPDLPGQQSYRMPCR